MLVSIPDTLHHRVALVGHSGRPGNTLIISHTSAIYTHSLTQLPAHSLLWKPRQNKCLANTSNQTTRSPKKLSILFSESQTDPDLLVFRQVFRWFICLWLHCVIKRKNLLPGTSKSLRKLPPPPLNFYLFTDPKPTRCILFCQAVALM